MGVSLPLKAVVPDNSDTASLDSYEDIEGPNSGTPKQRYQVDGTVPKVLYVVDYFNRDHEPRGSRQSDSPFKEIPDSCRDETVGSGEGSSEDQDKLVKKPVLEIVTEVCTTSRNPPPSTMNPDGSSANNRQKRPITMGFSRPEYHPENYFSDEQTHAASNRKVAQPYMTIHSAHLVNALKAVVSYYPYINLNTKVLSIDAPYRVLYHHRSELEEYRYHQPASHSSRYAATTTEHINILLEFLNTNLGEEIYQEKMRHGRTSPTATFEHLWLLFKPGQIVYAKRYDIWTPYVISDVQAADEATDVYTITGWMLESNGTKLERFMESFDITPWTGEQAIASLPVIPEAFWDDDPQAERTMRQKQIEEGKLYWELLQRPKYMQYDGLLVNSSSGNERAVGPTGFMCGRVVCDASGFGKYNQASLDGFPITRASYTGLTYGPRKDHIPKHRARCGCDACSHLAPNSDGPFAGFEDLDPLADTPPEDDVFYMVLCSTIPGFLLGSRKWGHLHVANLAPVQPDTEAFKYLVLDDEIKLTVKALIGKFAASADGKIAPWGNDFVKNKGEGRIFLLHGQPGVGKTCTAECIAEMTNRPLLSLTSGDLTVNSLHVDSKLSHFLELGQRYGALVLLDEADVYLERRRAKDIERNSLVSVFLRALEYYRGVLFLTTNRVRSFDAAFLSRIHVALHYKSLRHEDRERIWTQNFDRLGRDSGGRVRVAVAAREYAWGAREVRDLRWNGREIRNAMQTALALAEADPQDEELGADVVVAEKHLRAVVKMSRGFRDYVKKARSSSPASFRPVCRPLDDDDDDVSIDHGSDSDRDNFALHARY